MDPTQTTPEEAPRSFLGPAPVYEDADPSAPEESDHPAETETEEPAPADNPADTDTDTPAADPEPRKDYRFRDQDEAERGYKNLQGKFTQTAQEAADLKKRLKAIEDGEASRKREAEIDAKIEEFVTDKNAELLESLDRLDPDAEDYAKKHAALNAQYTRNLREYERTIRSDFDRQAAEESPPHAPETPQPDEYDVQADRDRVARMVTDAGLNIDDPDFMGFAPKAPVYDESGQPLPLKAQVEWAIQETRKHRESLLAKHRQKTDQPLGRRGPSKPARKAEPAVPVTLGATLRRRTL